MAYQGTIWYRYRWGAGGAFIEVHCFHHDLCLLFSDNIWVRRWWRTAQVSVLDCEALEIYLLALLRSCLFHLSKRELTPIVQELLAKKVQLFRNLLLFVNELTEHPSLRLMRNSGSTAQHGQRYSRICDDEFFHLGGPLLLEYRRGRRLSICVEWGVQM